MAFVFGSWWAACAQGSAGQSPSGPESLFLGGGGRPSLAREVQPMARHPWDLLWAWRKGRGSPPFQLLLTLRMAARKGGQFFRLSPSDQHWELEERRDSSLVMQDPIYRAMHPKDFSQKDFSQRDFSQRMVPGNDGPFGRCSWPKEQRSRYRWRGEALCSPRSSDAFDWADTQFLHFKQAWQWANSLGGGVVIGHPDTGYRLHAEIVQQVLKQKAINYVEKGQVALDTLKGYASAHGTRTASVMVSPPGRQPYTVTAKQHFIYGADPQGYPFSEGIAPESKIIPYRVAKGDVTQVFYRKLTRAIKQGIKDQVGVISISLGGVNSVSRLRRAIQEADLQGIIIVAAAGNYLPFKTVVWPARYPQVVAVAASDSDGKPWRHSSRGKHVDITAPGAGVWVASAHLGSDGQVLHEVTRSNGTSLSTAYVAGGGGVVSLPPRPQSIKRNLWQGKYRQAL